ncbi:NMT2 tetradecanoyltransferase, partial [Polypterus senegalus]
MEAGPEVEECWEGAVVDDGIADVIGGGQRKGGSSVLREGVVLSAFFFSIMAEDSESAASQQSLELDDQDTCGIDGDNEEENEHMQGSPGGDVGAKKKKKKQKRKKEKPSSGGTKSDSASDSQDIKAQQPPKQNPAVPMQKLQDIQRAMELLSACQGPAKNIDEATKHKYQFWDTQPVPKLNEVVTTHGPIEPDKENIRQEPYSLPQGFMWDTLDLGNAEVLKELYTLLNENYVEDDDNMFRFDYSPNFLKWALRPPGWLPHWHCGVRVSSNKKLVGFISAIPANIRIYDTVKKMVEINFLCVHKKLRSKRVAPVLIREITRRVNLEGIFQAVYTAGVVLPKPVSTCSWRARLPRNPSSHSTVPSTKHNTKTLLSLPPPQLCPPSTQLWPLSGGCWLPFIGHPEVPQVGDCQHPAALPGKAKPVPKMDQPLLLRHPQAAPVEPHRVAQNSKPHEALEKSEIQLQPREAAI